MDVVRDAYEFASSRDSSHVFGDVVVAPDPIQCRSMIARITRRTEFHCKGSNIRRQSFVFYDMADETR